MKKIVLAFDSFKGSVGSFEIAKAAEKAIQEELPDCQIIRIVWYRKQWCDGYYRNGLGLRSAID